MPNSKQIHHNHLSERDGKSNPPCPTAEECAISKENCSKNCGRSSRSGRANDGRRVDVNQSKVPKSASQMVSKTKSTWCDVLKGQPRKTAPHHSHKHIGNTPFRKSVGKSRIDTGKISSTSNLSAGTSEYIPPIHNPSINLSESCSDSIFEDDLISYMDQSVQCNILSTNDLKRNRIGYNGFSINQSDFSKLSGGSFAPYNPVRTMNFLVKEMKGVLRKSLPSDNIVRILSDMEETLTRIPSESENNFNNFSANLPPHSPPCRDKPSSVPIKFQSQEKLLKSESLTRSSILPDDLPVLHKPDSKSLSRGIIKPTFEIPLQDTGKEFHESNARKPSLSCLDSQAIPQNKSKSKTALHKSASKRDLLEMEVTVQKAVEKLELTCQQMETTCNQLKKERDVLIEEVNRKNAEIASVNKKEKSLEANLEIINKKTEEYCKTIQEMSALTNKLKSDNKLIPSLQESQIKLTQEIKERIQENDKLRMDLEIMKLENEKLHTLISTKDQELEIFKSELGGIKQLLTDQMVNLKQLAAVQAPLFPGQDTFVDTDSSPDDMSKKYAKKRPVCSSPTSSLSSSYGVSPSWQMISSITQQEFQSIDDYHCDDNPGNMQANDGNVSNKRDSESSDCSPVLFTVLEVPKAEEPSASNVFQQLKVRPRIDFGISLPQAMTSFMVEEPQPSVVLTDISYTEQISNTDKAVKTQKRKVK